MKKTTSPLFSQYILDGVQMDQTPFSALYDCLDGNGTVDVPPGPFEEIVDEYMDKVPTNFEYDFSRINKYAETILKSAVNEKKVNLDYPVSWTKAAINSILLDKIFLDGHFCMQDILLMAKWDWNNAPAGNMAAFYDSTVTAGRYLFDLGIKLDRYFVEENRHGCFMELSVRSKMASRRKCSGTMLPNPSDWIIFIPFDNGRMCLGGSALSSLIGQGSGAETDSQDPDYFIDCYEVVRELVEDGVIAAGISVGRGGLMCAAERFRARKALSIDVGGICGVSSETDLIKVLFAEMPGVIVQIRDEDYDYFDSQFLLQEIAYCPLGHPSADNGELSVSCTDRSGISDILRSLMDQATEGED